MSSPALLTRFQIDVLRRLAPPVPVPLKTVYDGKSKLAATFGEKFLQLVGGRTVMDFGCGNGLEVIEIAKAGAKLVVGVEIDEPLLLTAQRNAEQAGVSDRCRFISRPAEAVDLVISL